MVPSSFSNDDTTRQMPRSAAAAPPTVSAGVKVNGCARRVNLKSVFAVPFTLLLLSALLAGVMFQASGRSRAQDIYADMLQVVLTDPQYRADLS